MGFSLKKKKGTFFSGGGVGYKELLKPRNLLQGNKRNGFLVRGLLRCSVSHFFCNKRARTTMIDARRIFFFFLVDCFWL